MQYAITAGFLLAVVAGSFATVILGGYGIARLIAFALLSCDSAVITAARIPGRRQRCRFDDKGFPDGKGSAGTNPVGAGLGPPRRAGLDRRAQECRA